MFKFGIKKMSVNIMLLEKSYMSKECHQEMLIVGSV